jgi:hypothetical protein
MSNEKQKIDPYIASWITCDGFCTLFYRMCGEYTTQELAYEAAERMYQSQFGERRYASYESFKNTRNQKIRSRNK